MEKTSRRTVRTIIYNSLIVGKLIGLLIGFIILFLTTFSGFSLVLAGGWYYSILGIVLAIRFISQTIDALANARTWRRIIRQPVIDTLRQQVEIRSNVISPIAVDLASRREQMENELYHRWRAELALAMGDPAFRLMQSDPDYTFAYLAERHVTIADRRMLYGYWRQDAANWGQAATLDLEFPTLWEYHAAQTGLNVLDDTIRAQFDAYTNRHLPADAMAYGERKVAPITYAVPIYGMSPDDVRQTVESFTWQSLLPRKIYLVLNSDKDQVLATAIPQIIAEQPYPELFQFFIQPLAGKRRAMTTAFRASLGLPIYTTRDLELGPQLKDRYPELFTTAASLTPVTVQRIRYDVTGNASLHSFEMGVQWIGNVDGDGILDPDINLVTIRAFLADPNLVGSTSNSQIHNGHEGRLARDTSSRYKDVNFYERGAQSRHGQVVCFSGPHMVMRAEELALILEEWSYQKFFGVYVHVGDDRRLSKICNLRGWKTIALFDSVVWTESPIIIFFKWFLQQLRWSRSGGREYLLDFIKWNKKLHPKVSFDQHYLMLFPFLVISVFMASGVFAYQMGLIMYYATGDLRIAAATAIVSVLPLAMIFLTSNLARGLRLVYVTKDWGDLRMAWYFRYQPLLIFIKLRGLVTMNQAGKWLTRGAAKPKK